MDNLFAYALLQRALNSTKIVFLNVNDIAPYSLTHVMIPDKVKVGIYLGLFDPVTTHSSHYWFHDNRINRHCAVLFRKTTGKTVNSTLTRYRSILLRADGAVTTTTVNVLALTTPTPTATRPSITTSTTVSIKTLPVTSTTPHTTQSTGRHMDNADAPHPDSGSISPSVTV